MCRPTDEIGGSTSWLGAASDEDNPEEHGRVRYGIFAKLIDADTDDANPNVVQPNITQGNWQIAHGIERVRRPVNL